MRKKGLSNEFLRRHFEGNFSLANFAISVGREEVKAERFTNLDNLLKTIEERVDLITDPEQKKQLGIKD